MKRQIQLWLFLLSASTLWGQSILDRYIQQGLDSNLALQQEEQLLASANQQLKLAKGLFHPNVSFNASYTLARGGRTIDVPVGDLLNPVYGSLNELAGANRFPTNLKNSQEPILPNNFHDTRLELRQALFNTDIYFNYKAKEWLISVQEAKKETYIQELKKEIKKGYYNYLQTVELLNIYDSTETVLKELVRVNQLLVDNHKATKDVVFRAQLELEALYGDRTVAH
ncbi:MAG: TolC family protein, partial [Bacteroidota bacterium]